MILPPLIGHAEATGQIGRLLESGRFPHSLLLHGPKGIGKRLLADHLAWRLICGPAGSSGPDMFGEDAPASPLAFDATAEQAAQLQAGSCPDLHLLAPEKKSIGIGAVREMLGTLLRTADTSRVVVVDALDNFTEEAANALLKVLEEPRPDVYFLLVCHRLSMVLPTIRSRCRLLRLHPLSLEDTRAVLEKEGADATLAPVAGGCPGQVIGNDAETLQQVMAMLRPLMRNETPTKMPGVKEAPWVPEALLRLLAEQTPGLKQARAYAAIRKLQAEAAEINLPHMLVAEAALAQVQC